MFTFRNTFRKLFAVAVLGVASALALAATGCASGDKPYGLTGGDGGDRKALQKELAERQRWTDQKGRYRPEWRHGNAPVGYPKGRPVSD